MRPLLLSIVLVIAVSAEADDPDFKPLFNGKDLSGWVPVNVAPDTFSVKDGMIYCTGVPTGVMRSERMYENFVVELEWRHLTPKGNSGFFVWSDAITSKGVPFTRAVENQILDGPNHPQRNYTTHGDVFAIHGATLTPGNPGKFSMRAYPTEDRSKPSPEWNHYRITCDRGAISLAVNGKIVTTGKDASPRKGYICLESEGGQVEFRNLRIKELPADANLDPKHVAKADEGYKSLYTGIDLTNWSANPGWKPQDWILHYEPPENTKKSAAALWSTEKFAADLDMIVDLRSTEPLTIKLRGADLTIGPPAKPTWRRLHLLTKDNRFSATIDDQPALSAAMTQLNGPIGFDPGGPTDLANFYIRRMR
jgi:Domain of Unknown Function (DUF1080)